MRLLFLDFDGVLHPSGGPAGETLPFEWGPVLAELIADFPDVAVVVHSSWRERFSMDYIRDFLEPLGDQLQGVTPAGPKNESIKQYLAGLHDVSSAAVLDDQPDEVAGIAGLRVIACDPLKGLSCLKVQGQLRAWLAADSTHKR